MKFLFVGVTFFSFLVSAARADENPFAFTYTTEVLPKGRWEFEQWATGRWQKEAGTYNVVALREELEYGVTDNFQLALYLNHHYVDAKNNLPAEDPARPGRRLRGAYVTDGEDVPVGHDPRTSYRNYRFESVSIEAIYRLLDVDERPIGLALYLEPEWGRDARGVEAKILLQKNWMEERLVWAANINFEFEAEKNEGGDFEDSGALEFFTGLSYRVASHWQTGLEFWNHHEFDGLTTHEYCAYFIGPTIQYATKRWSVMLGYLRQLPCGQAFNQEAKEFAAHHGYILGAEHEKNYLQLKFGIEL
ncbi:MAG: DUF6662 family protein [Chthoniobacterales bacterium]